LEGLEEEFPEFRIGEGIEGNAAEAAKKIERFIGGGEGSAEGFRGGAGGVHGLNIGGGMADFRVGLLALLIAFCKMLARVICGILLHEGVAGASDPFLQMLARV
jgi:hypothetical protein